MRNCWRLAVKYTSCSGVGGVGGGWGLGARLCGLPISQSTGSLPRCRYTGYTRCKRAILARRSAPRYPHGVSASWVQAAKYSARRQQARFPAKQHTHEAQDAGRRLLACLGVQREQGVEEGVKLLGARGGARPRLLLAQDAAQALRQGGARARRDRAGR